MVLINMSINRGKVYLVGAGPGDPKLITIRGFECVKNADVIIYDNLVSKALVNQANPGARLIFVGKSRGKHTMEQSEINGLLAKYAEENLVVTRLKGGDSFIFGRGGEEAEFLHGKNINYEIVPGVTSAHGVPVYAGIPLTHRTVASSVVFVTGHEDISREGSRIDWKSIARLDTIVILMGVKNLAKIVDELVRNGKASKVPVAMIIWGSTPRQKVLIGTLDNIVEKANKERVKPPAVIVVGDVVNLSKKLSWYEKKPLFGKRIIVTRAAEQAQELISEIEEGGGTVIEVPTIKFVDPDDNYDKLDMSIKKLSRKEFNWVIFTSANAIKFFLQRAGNLGNDTLDLLKPVKIAAIGKSTASYLSTLGIKTDFIPKDYVAESFVDGFVEVAAENERVLIPRAQFARNIIPDALTKIGLQVYIAAAYKNIPCDSIESATLEEIKNQTPDYITFTSSSTVRNFLMLAEGASIASIVKKIKTVSIGPITSRAIKELGFKEPLEAKKSTLSNLVETIVFDCKK